MERKYEAKEVNRLLKNIKKLSQGEFDLDFHEFEVEDDLKHLSVTYKVINDNLGKSVDMISGLVHEISYVLTNLANNNLDVLVEAEYKGEFAEIRNALQKIITSLNEVVKDILVTSEEVNQGANEISTSSQSLSSGATQQASAIEEISATVTQVAAQVKENAKNAEQVKSVANNNKNSAQYSDTQMTELVTSMSDIQKSTANIQKVLKMINDIAFQTNILSLNAAVEAARAGQHGKGFAVIAEDVRNLALKSASAADETSDMLETMVQKITSGSELAYETAQSLKQIVEGADETVKISSEVASASNEQSIAVNQITLSLDQVSQVVQSTSVTARQGASTSNELREYANKLMDTVGEFRVVSEAIDWQALELKRQANILRELFEWDDSYSVEVNQMDNHHMRLFDLMNETYFALERNESRDAVRKILDELYDYTDYHFAEEEQMMLKIGYDKFDMHKELHTKFLAQIKSAIDGIDTVNLKVFKDETLEILGDWLFKHIKGIDKGYTEFAHNHDYY
jgi:hemerythrin-like metal-binding protein